jgi:hypothetical protein
MKDWGQLMKEAAREPAHVRELVAGEAAYKGTLDASGEGAGGLWFPGKNPLHPWSGRYNGHRKSRMP